ncbi:MAG TPA: hypothetical protein VMU94_12230 [Streptosporangiaceae bacterium]|nr:hypothetical protein [Streptosporangiaceae bacterium]
MARRLITDLALPAGARTTVPRPVPALLHHPGQDAGSGDTIDLHKFFSIRQPMRSAASSTGSRPTRSCC